jgi:hypothetical protein
MQLLDDVDFEIDKEDYKLLYAIVSEGNLSNILKARILIKLEECKDAS